MIKEKTMINYIKNLEEKISYIKKIDISNYDNLLYINIDFSESKIIYSEIIFSILIEEDYIIIYDIDNIELLKIYNDDKIFNIIKLFIKKNIIEFNYEISKKEYF